ncbi:hypothetical protein [Sphingobium sp. EM0848]|uniref:hypothetical protein n=1 Tax=Sphingobium sp. EM0848 TaxID=2743473 RepID=UPI00159C2947|nr:hypothetical protein [Sphingobium sp. EM0848]
MPITFEIIRDVDQHGVHYAVMAPHAHVFRELARATSSLSDANMICEPPKGDPNFISTLGSKIAFLLRMPLSRSSPSIGKIPVICWPLEIQSLCPDSGGQALAGM